MLLNTLHRAVSLACLSGCLAMPALAQMPGPVKTSHPHVLITPEDLQRVKDKIGIMHDAVFPAEAGSISFNFTPRQRTAGNDANIVIYGELQSGRNAFFIQHADDKDAKDGSVVALNLIFQRVEGGYAANATLNLPVDVSSQVALSWDRKNNKIALTVNGKPLPIAWNNTTSLEWTAASQVSDFRGRSGELMEDFIIRDVSQHIVKEYKSVDLPLRSALNDYLISARENWKRLQNCPVSDNPTTDQTICNTATAGRNLLFGYAMNFALAYQFSRNEEYLKAARRYADLMFALKDKRDLGGEWTQGSRVGAMGILYDWLYGSIGEDYQRRLADEIKATIRTDKDKSSDDLIGDICGYGNTVTGSAAALDCTVAPQLTSAAFPSIARFYITGHHQSGATGAMMGLLAIAGEDGSVHPMLNTIYRHFSDGFVPARAQISVDGAYHSGFGYGTSEMPERLMLWKKALADGSAHPKLEAPWMEKLIYPYIYGMRHDKTFPAQGDAYDFAVTDRTIGQLALAAVRQNRDPMAMTFYNRYIKSQRPRFTDHYTLLENLFLPHEEIGEGDLSQLPLSRAFRVAGQVLMRDSWNYPEATLLDFKSSSFISVNHQHMDQNSYSLNYKAPLLLDSGLYDEYDTTHWWNYYTRTIAHNSIVVFDKKERFLRGEVPVSNDGGQWRGTRDAYPLLSEIQPGASHWLHGVTHFEENSQFSYTVGNASRAYSADKMDQQNGFVRSILFFQPTPSRSKPIILVFDSVRTRGLPATSLLHFATKPVGYAGITQEEPGRYRLAFDANATPALTVRNGKGMVTVRPLLPAKASLLLSGGDNGAKCLQGKEKDSQPPPSPDCRFLVQTQQTDGSIKWVNYAPGAKKDKLLDDLGAWRLEIASAETAAPAQYFLNVLDVADVPDSDDGSKVAATPAAKLLTRLDADTEALLLEEDLMVLFNRGTAPAGKYSWQAGHAYSKVLATGLKPNTAYAYTVQQGDQHAEFRLEERADGSLRASAQGVLRIGH